jgi:hypothetical protein
MTDTITKIKSILTWKTEDGDYEQKQFDTPKLAQYEMFRQVAEVLGIEREDFEPDINNLNLEILATMSGYELEGDFYCKENSAWAYGIHHTNHDREIMTIAVSNALPETEIHIN